MTISSLITKARAWADARSAHGWLVHGLGAAAWCVFCLAIDAVPALELGPGVVTGMAWYYTFREAFQAIERKGLPTDDVPEWGDRGFDVLVPWIVTALLWYRG